MKVSFDKEGKIGPFNRTILALNLFWVILLLASAMTYLSSIHDSGDRYRDYFEGKGSDTKIAASDKIDWISQKDVKSIAAISEDAYNYVIYSLVSATSLKKEFLLTMPHVPAEFADSEHISGVEEMASQGYNINTFVGKTAQVDSVNIVPDTLEEHNEKYDYVDSLVCNRMGPLEVTAFDNNFKPVVNGRDAMAGWRMTLRRSKESTNPVDWEIVRIENNYAGCMIDRQSHKDNK